MADENNSTDQNNSTAQTTNTPRLTEQEQQILAQAKAAYDEAIAQGQSVAQAEGVASDILDDTTLPTEFKTTTLNSWRVISNDQAEQATETNTVQLTGNSNDDDDPSVPTGVLSNDNNTILNLANNSSTNTNETASIVTKVDRIEITGLTGLSGIDQNGSQVTRTEITEFTDENNTVTSSRSFAPITAETQADITLSAQADVTPPTTTLSGVVLSADNGASADFITNTASQTISVTLGQALAGDESVWGSVDGGTTWTQVPSGSIAGTSVTWSTTLKDGENTIQLAVRDTAGNVGPKIKQEYTLDTTAPMASASADTISSSESAKVISSEIGTAYLVDSTIKVTSLSDITGSADSKWNQVAITEAGKETNLAATGLADGKYKVYTTDAAGNLSSASSDVVTVENVNKSIVVFDLTKGESSSHSNRTFDADVSYKIYIVVDSDSAMVKLNSGSRWGGWANLGANDEVILVGNGSKVVSGNGQNVSRMVIDTTQDTAAARWKHGSREGFNILSNGKVGRRAQGDSVRATLAVDRTRWGDNPNGDDVAFSMRYKTALPTTIANSQPMS
ncbi:Ig-like domain-containing protein [Marinomonas sp.]|uniref:Ig-like domain-containing protein n=1 Tax=Marinomonas sp. TaxID=1904862 RepID=UPI003BA8CBC7